jgi:Predicted membrane protein (DUF2157)
MQPSPDLSAQVDRWVASGIITPDQAERIRADLAMHTPTASRPVSLVTEGLGYLGGVIVVVGVGLVIGISWENLAAGARVAIAGAVWLILTLAGALIPAQRLGATGARLRGVLWTGATIAGAAGLGLMGSDLLRWESDLVTLVASGGAAIMSAATWAVSRHILQHFSTLAALLFVAWTGTEMLTIDVIGLHNAYVADMWSSFVVWGIGLVWFALSLLKILPQTSAVIGAFSMMVYQEWGSAFALGTAIALVAVAVVRRQLGVLGVGSVATLISLPFTVGQYFPGVLPAALALVVGGLALVGVAVFTARRRRSPAPA